MVKEIRCSYGWIIGTLRAIFMRDLAMGLYMMQLAMLMLEFWVFLQNGYWSWGPARSDELVTIQAEVFSSWFGDTDGVIKYNGFLPGQFTCRAAWECIRDGQQKLEWSKLIWLSGSIVYTKVCIYILMTVENCLASCDRLASLGYWGDYSVSFVGGQLSVGITSFFNALFL